MARNITHDEMQHVVNYLQGTCMSIEEAFAQLEIEGLEDRDSVVNEEEFYAFLDNQIFECGQCGWWCETGDWMDDSHPDWSPSVEICSSCAPEVEEEED